MFAVEAEPTGEPLGHLAHRRERRTGPRGGVRDRVLDHRGAVLRGPADADVRPVEREHLRGVDRVDQEERGPVRDVVPEQRRRFVPVRRATRGVEERDVVGVGKLLLRSPGELAETNREHSGAQGMLERLPRTEVGREREGADHLGRADRAFLPRRCCCDAAGVLSRHGVILRRPPGRACGGIRGLGATRLG